MQRRLQRTISSSPIDRLASPFEPGETELGLVDREDRNERRNAQLWRQRAKFVSDPWLDQPHKEEYGFEGFRPADPVSRLDSSAQAVQSASNPASSVRGSSTHGSFVSVTAPDAIANSLPEMMNPQGNIYPDLDRKQITHGVDWANPAGSADGQQIRTGSQETDSIVPFQQIHPVRRQSSFWRESQDSIESHRTTLKKLKNSSTSDSISTASSVTRWLGGQRRKKPELRLAGLAKNNIEEDSPEQESPPGLHQHISTFQPADQHIYSKTKSHDQERASQEDKMARRASISPDFPLYSPQKEYKHGFFGFFGLGHKKRAKQQAVSEKRPSTIDSSRRKEDPFGQLSSLIYEPTKASGRGRTGYFTRTAQSSEGDETAPVKGPFVGFRRRTESIESFPERGCKLKEPEPPPLDHDDWLKPRRPRLTRYSSSPISPGDTSARAMANISAYNQWKDVLAKTTPHLQFNSAQLNASKPVQPSPMLPKPATSYLATEAPARTPPHPGKWQDNMKTGYLWNSLYSRGAEREGSDNGSNQWHTPFPMPQDPPINTSFNDSETRERHWYRIRVDRVSGEEEPRDLEELRMIEWDIPEHLPGSPLCPLSPKHPSKGKGVCVYHDRKRRGGAL